jgi:NAD(P)H dehydrogenase (quinone)
VIVSTGSTESVLFEPTNGNPYGASSVSRNQPGNVHEENLAAVEFQARRTVAVATALVRGFADAA